MSSLEATTAAALEELERLEAVIERGLGTFVEVGRALLEIRDRRLYRERGYERFEDYCRERWGFVASRARQLIAAAESVTTVTAAGLPAPANERQARELAPLLRRDEAEAVQVWRELRERYGEGVTAERVRRLVAARLARDARERAAAERRRAEAEAITTTWSSGDVELRLGDLRSALDDLAGTVDAIITDPPYGNEHLHLYDALGEVSARLLRPGGLVAVMVGQSHLPEYLARLGRHLPYRWTCAYLTPGPSARVFGRKVATKWKPVLLFGGDKFLIHDTFHADGPDKRYHPWGQAEAVIREIVERLTDPGQLVVDPFLGGGTTAAVCRRLGRRFVGCDIDPGAVAAARRRLEGLARVSEAAPS